MIKKKVLKYNSIHFVGIGGISMSGLAKLCLNMGITVSGSDKTRTDLTDELSHLGIKIFYKHQKSNIFGADLVVYTCAVGEDNIEVKTAKEMGIAVLERADFLGEVAKGYKNVIAISGSHGKTTVCGMLGKIFQVAQKNPTILVGGEVGKNNNVVIGKNDFLIVEACEYKEHFLKIPHNVGVVLNIDYDHPDYFKTIKSYEAAFQKFAKNSDCITFIDEKYSILFDKKIESFGDNGSFQARHIFVKDNYILFDVYKKGKFFDRIKMFSICLYNIKNALCAVAVADYFGIDKNDIKNGLLQFENLKRRYEYMGKINGNIVITDYAHHPTQIKNCILSTRDVYSKEITVVFEPHTYTRTKFLFNDFVKALSLADNIILLPTYSAREKTQKGGTSKDLFEALRFVKKKVCYVKSYKKCYKELEKLKDNLILILGAGSVVKLAEKIKYDFLSSNQN